MHRALELEEILLNIFGHCHCQPSSSVNKGHAELAALARTCRTFKEPALDVLWTELVNLSPLARCLPEASHRIYQRCSWYAFSRPLKPSEWDTLRSYARRVRSIMDFTRGLNWESVKTLFNPPTSDPLFPNLRVLRWDFIKETFPLMRHLTVPSLTSLEIKFVFGDMPPFQSFPHSLGDLCPHLRKVRIRMRRHQAGSDETVCGLVCRWTSLQELFCPYTKLNLGALVHLSSAPSLTSLSFMLSSATAERIRSADAMMLFPRLRDLEISAGSLERISILFSHSQLPAIESITVFVDRYPSKQALRTYLTGIQKICTLHSVTSLRIIQGRSMEREYSPNGSERSPLTLEDLFPYMAFGNLRHLDINIATSAVHLADDEILSLASAWPHLERLLINEEWGWKTEGGITPGGLLQLLQTLPSLRHFCLAIDTRGYTETPKMVKATLAGGFTAHTPLSVNVSDSVIQPECVDALAEFFGAITEWKRASASSWYWSTSAMTSRRDTEILERLWEDVFMKAHQNVQVQYRVSTLS